MVTNAVLTIYFLFQQFNVISLCKKKAGLL